MGKTRRTSAEQAREWLARGDVPDAGKLKAMAARDIARQALVKRDALATKLLVVAPPPASASANIAPAPARGALVARPQHETVMTPNGPRVRRTTQDGFHPVAAQDAFDVMALQAKRRDAGGLPLFSVGQVEAGRTYAALAERCASEGLRCSSPEARQGGGQQVDWIEGVIARSARLAAMHRAIGTDVVLPVSGSAGAELVGRRAVSVRLLVDQVCCEGMSVSEVLRRAGWPVRGARVTDVLGHLTEALNRMQGL